MSVSSARTPDAMPIMEHLRELRSRIIRSFLAIAVASLTMLTVYDPVKNFLTQPYRNLCSSRPDFKCDGSLFSLGPLDGFSARMRICLYGGVVLALPVILWQIWRFIVPALSKKEKRYAVPFIASSIVLFAVGCSLAYWTLDKALEFLISWSGTDVSQAYQVTKYISLVVLMMLAFGIGFLSPVLLVFLQLVSVVTPRALIKQWRYAVMGIFVAAAVITPSGDPVSMLALAVPLSVLYLLSALVGWLLVRRRAT
ncbi:MAG: Sec-independent protein translocase protein TatC [actinobacterium acAcidi]|jgi:sec-independent protein translocase protein TatC|nr:MAG: Sec-independent protein translocase protein TatC [actinobacterium acAcidi]